MAEAKLGIVTPTVKKKPEFRMSHKDLEVGDLITIFNTKYKVMKILNRGRIILKRINAN